MTDSYRPLFNTRENGDVSRTSTSSANDVTSENVSTSTTGGYNPIFNTRGGGTSQAATSSANNVSPESALASTAGGYNPTFNTQGNEDASSTSTSPATNESTEAISTATTPGYNPTFNTQGNETTSTGLSAANDTTIAVNSSDTLKTFITSLGSFLKTLATQIRNVTPNATDENFQQLQENLIGKTILTAKQAKETLDSFANVLDALAELTESTAQEIDSLDIPTTASSSGENRAGETVMLSLNSSESEGNSSNESTTAASDYAPTSPGESTIDLTPTETSNISLESATNTTESSLEDAPSDSGQLGETSLSSAESQIVLGTESPNSTPANQLPADSPVATDGPTKPVGNALYIPNQSPAYTMLSASMDDIRATYPSVPINNSIQAEIAAELMGQNTSYGSQQPADTIHLTDQQVRILSEAIAHNINVRRQMAAQEMVAGMNLDGFGYDGADFELGSVSNDFQQAVLDICDQVIQAGLPYAWGGGSLDGPSQGISDGGGYADACGDYAKIGFDCSGFSRYVFYQATGVELPRVAQAQCDYSVLIDEPMIGDLGFPSNYNPGHVVVYVGNGEIAEAQQSGTNLMYSPASPSYVWKRPPESPNWDY